MPNLHQQSLHTYIAYCASQGPSRKQSTHSKSFEDGLRGPFSKHSMRRSYMRRNSTPGLVVVRASTTPTPEGAQSRRSGQNLEAEGVMQRELLGCYPPLRDTANPWEHLREEAEEINTLTSLSSLPSVSCQGSTSAKSRNQRARKTLTWSIHSSKAEWRRVPLSGEGNTKDIQHSHFHIETDHKHIGKGTCCFSESVSSEEFENPGAILPPQRKSLSEKENKQREAKLSNGGKRN